MRNRSFAGPVILIGLGAIFLINNVMPELSVWHLLADWWPLLLVAFGLIRLAEALAIHGPGRGTATTATVRPMGFGWILAAVFVGLAITIPHHMNPHWKWGPIPITHVADFLGEEFDYPVSVVSPVGSAKRLVLDNIRGGITVTGADAADIHLDGHKVIHAFDRNDADKLNNEAKVTFSPEGDAIFIRAVEPANQGDSRLSVDMEITVPKGMSVEARGRSGDLTINSIDGAVDVSSQHGDVRLQDIGGNAKIDTAHSELVRVSNMKGTLDIEGSGKDVQVDTVAGLVTLNGRFSGTLDFRDLAKPLHFESEQTDLRVEKLPGSLSLTLSELHGSNLTGPFRFVTHERDVHLDDFTGPVDIEIGKGDVDLKPTQSQSLARIDVRSRSGNIEVALPADGKFDLKGTAKQGDVTNDFGDAIVSDSQGRTNTLRSANAAGPAITLDTDRGEVSVRKNE